MFMVALVAFIDVVALTLSFPAKAALIEKAKKMVPSTIPIIMEFFISILLFFAFLTLEFKTIYVRIRRKIFGNLL